MVLEEARLRPYERRRAVEKKKMKREEELAEAEREEAEVSQMTEAGVGTLLRGCAPLLSQTLTLIRTSVFMFKPSP